MPTVRIASVHRFAASSLPVGPPTPIALKAELTQRSYCQYAFYFQRTGWLSGLKFGVKKTASICLAEFSTNRTQQLICRLAHLITIDIVFGTVKPGIRFRSRFEE